LYLYNRTRIHMDIVDDLGEFIELEVIMGRDDNHLNGKEEARSLINQLKIAEEDLINCSYIDLLESK
ncbi:MAG: CYTH domain-containing protein, partial [Thermodesulfobacteriota bacterium]